MIGIDTNILVADALPDHPEHRRVSRALNSCLSGGHQIALTPLVVSEFIHVSTDPRRFENPLSVAEAVAQTEFWTSSAETVLLSIDPTSHRQWLHWLAEHRLGRKRLLDTLLAATWHTAGVHEIFTLNPRDFEIFGVFVIRAIGTGDR